MKRKLAAAFWALILVTGLTGCGEENEKNSMEKSLTTLREDFGKKDETEANSAPGKDAEDGRAFAVLGGLFENKKDAVGTVDLAAMPEQLMAVEMDSFAYEAEEYPVIEWNTEEYKYYAENPWMSVQASPFSTFAADVDTASYANIRRMLLGGQTIPADAVRIEEMINYFSYDYPEPDTDVPFFVTTEIAPCPWNENTELLLIGLQTKKPDLREKPDSNLVFLVDVSGSMSDSDKLPLIQQAFRLLCEELTEKDRVSLVTYATGDKTILEGVSGEEKTKINAAMEDLSANGGTNGSAGIQTAYELAERYFIEGGNNRVILATDGDLNIGVTDEGSLVRLIEEKAKNGVFLSVLGFGRGNISDTRMEALADHGNGNYNYIDSVAEARKVLIEEMGATLFTVAKDVKLQVEFNPAMIKGYRLIGYENRTMAAESFADDTKDGGEIGAGHSVTALYEIAKVDSAQEVPEVESRYGTQAQRQGSETQKEGEREYLTVNIRYKEPDQDSGKLLTYVVDSGFEKEQMSDNLSWAAGVAQMGMLLKESEYAGNTVGKEVLKRMEELESVRGDDYRKEFLYLFSRYTR